MYAVRIASRDKYVTYLFSVFFYPFNSLWESKSKQTNMANVKIVLPLYQKLTEEWNKRSPNLDECGKLLASLKVCVFFIIYSGSSYYLVIRRNALSCKFVNLPQMTNRGMTNYRIGPHRTCGREMRENWGK